MAILMPVTAFAAVVDSYWPAMHKAFFAGKEIADGSDFIKLEAAERAENAALVPFAFTIDYPTQTGNYISQVYVLTDANPVQLTATFHFTPEMPPVIASRIRLEKDTYVRVIAETSSGKLYMAKIAIKTLGGGCGGGVSINETKLRAEAGRMKINVQTPQSGITNQLSFNIKHPMRTGFERTVQGYYAKAYYINRLDFSLDGKPLLGMDVGVGISADPYLHFSYPQTGKVLAVKASDNEGKAYDQQWALPDH
ncbi:MAG: quinoprotein dehydrogenase-associated SoxYZ-like carrier [Methylophilaceae bacterium]